MQDKEQQHPYVLEPVSPINEDHRMSKKPRGLYAHIVLRSMMGVNRERDVHTLDKIF